MIGNVYRLPDDNGFNARLKEALDQIWLRRNNIIVIDDMNSDLLKNDITGRWEKAIRYIMNSLDLKNVIRKPTRIKNLLCRH